MNFLWDLTKFPKGYEGHEWHVTFFLAHTVCLATSCTVSQSMNNSLAPLSISAYAHPSSTWYANPSTSIIEDPNNEREYIEHGKILDMKSSGISRRNLTIIDFRTRKWPFRFCLNGTEWNGNVTILLTTYCTSLHFSNKLCI